MMKCFPDRHYLIFIYLFCTETGKEADELYRNCHFIGQH